MNNLESITNTFLESICADKTAGIGEKVKRYFAHATLVGVSALPLYAAIADIAVAQRTDLESLTLRTAMFLGNYSTAWIMLTLRQASKNKVKKLDEEGSETYQIGRDCLMPFTLNAIGAAVLYRYFGDVSGAANLFWASVASAAVSYVAGPWNGLLMDSCKDLMNWQECKRAAYPTFIKNLSPNAKKCVAAGIVAAEVALMSAVYAYTKDDSITRFVKHVYATLIPA